HEQRAAEDRRIEVAALLLVRLPRRVQRVHEDEGADATRIARGKLGRDQGAERPAADRRLLDSCPLEDLLDLVEIVLEPSLRIAGKRTRALLRPHRTDDASVL